MHEIKGQQWLGFFFCKKMDTDKEKKNNSVIQGEYPEYPITIKGAEIGGFVQIIQETSGDQVAG